MPTFKQLTCSIEVGSKNIVLTEHGVTYGDGVVGCYVAVPEEPNTFSIHLTSSGYIAPGLAMFVFMDGIPQCNRNRRNLIIPDANSEALETEVDFRVRQKEDKLGDGKYIGREWIFAQLNTTTADEAANVDQDLLHNIGTIEVVVLRCDTDSNSRGAYVIPPGRTTGLKGAKIAQNTGNDGASDHNADIGGVSKQGNSRTFGLDGPWDEDYDEYYDTRNYPPWAGYQHPPHRSYLAQYRPERPIAPHSSRRPVSEPRIINNYYYPPQPPQDLPSRFRAIDPETQKQINELLVKQNARVSGTGGTSGDQKSEEKGNNEGNQNRRDSKSGANRKIDSKPINNADTNPDWAQENTGWDNDNSKKDNEGSWSKANAGNWENPEWNTAGAFKTRASKQQKPFETPTKPTENWSGVNDSDPSGSPAKASNGEWNAASGAANSTPGAWGTPDKALSGDWNATAAVENVVPGAWGDEETTDTTTNPGGCDGQNDEETTKADTAPENEADWGAGGDNTANTGWPDDNNNTAATGGDSTKKDETTAQGGEADWTKGIPTWNTSAESTKKEETTAQDGEADWSKFACEAAADPKKEETTAQSGEADWSKVAPGSSAPAAKATIDKTETKTPNKTSTEPAKGHKSTLPDPNHSFVKPYWTNWDREPPSNSKQSHADRMYIAPEVPLLEVPAKLAEEQHMSHQVRAGKGVVYEHRTNRLKYIDTMQKPYAVFVFKYRSKEVLEKLLGITIKADREDYREKMKGLSKEEIIEKLMKAKKFAGYSSDSSLASESETEVEAEDAAKAEEEEKNEKGGKAKKEGKEAKKAEKKSETKAEKKSETKTSAEAPKATAAWEQKPVADGEW